MLNTTKIKFLLCTLEEDDFTKVASYDVATLNNDVFPRSPLQIGRQQGDKVASHFVRATNMNLTTASEVSSRGEHEEVIHLVGRVLFFAFALATNAVNVFVFFSKRFRQTTVACLLGTTALIDIGSLVTQFTAELQLVPEHLSRNQIWPLGLFLLHVSNWTLVLLTVERFIVARFQVCGGIFAPRGRRRYVVAFIGLVLAVGIVNIITYFVDKNPHPMYRNHCNSLPIGYTKLVVDSVSMWMVPILCIIDLNVWILVFTQKGRVRNAGGESAAIDHGRDFHRETSMVLTANLLFVITQIPVTSLLIYCTSAELVLGLDWSMLFLLNLHKACVFIMYCVCCPDFRKNLRSRFACVGCKTSYQSSYTTTV